MNPFFCSDSFNPTDENYPTVSNAFSFLMAKIATQRWDFTVLLLQRHNIAESIKHIHVIFKVTNC